MKKRFSFGRTVLLMLALLVLLISIVLVFGLAFLQDSPDVWSLLAPLMLGLLAIEFAAHYGPQPFLGPFGRLALRIPKTRDRIVLIFAFVIGYVLLYLPKAGVLLGRSWVISVVLMLVALLLFFGICFLFGTKDLRELLKIWHKDTGLVKRGSFAHEDQPALVVGKNKPDSVLFDPADFDQLVSRLSERGYQVKSKYHIEDSLLEFKLYRLERGRDKLYLQGETYKGIKLFGPQDLLDEVHDLTDTGNH